MKEIKKIEYRPGWNGGWSLRATCADGEEMIIDPDEAMRMFQIAIDKFGWVAELKPGNKLRRLKSALSPQPKVESK